MRCKRHARSWELRSAGIRYLTWCLAPDLAVVDPDALRYISTELVWAYWRTFLETLEEGDLERRFELVSWMLENLDDVSVRGYILANGTYVYREGVEPWPEGASLEKARTGAGLSRPEVATLLGCAVTGQDLRRLAHGLAWPESALLIHRVGILIPLLESLSEQGRPEQVRAGLFAPDTEGLSEYARLCAFMRTQKPLTKEALEEWCSTAALTAQARHSGVVVPPPAAQGDPA